ncbi:MAG: ThuA domain-containing protein [bacterium]
MRRCFSRASSANGHLLRRVGAAIACAIVALSLSPSAGAAAELPPHDPLRILIVSDEVNPHNLPDSALTQPGDLSAALLEPGTGLNLAGVTEIPTDDLPAATAALELPSGDPGAFDVLVYFAHRIPNGGGGPAAQAAFVAAVDAFLSAGGGVVSFHHGAYRTAGKESMVDLLGGEATGAVPWNTIEGQRVLDVSNGHWVATNGVAPEAEVNYADPANGIPSGLYPYFTNVPDERYPNLGLLPAAESVEILFASDYDEGGTTHVLGWTHRRAGWLGHVVVYQPGEYEPNALDVDGNNFQILANAILWSTRADDVSSPVEAGVTRDALRAWPNPFRNSIRFSAPSGRQVEVLDVAGRRVWRGRSGPDSQIWDGRDVTGRPVAAGVYFLRDASGGRMTRLVKMR